MIGLSTDGTQVKRPLEAGNCDICPNVLTAMWLDSGAPLWRSSARVSSHFGVPAPRIVRRVRPGRTLAYSRPSGRAHAWRVTDRRLQTTWVVVCARACGR